MKKILLLIILGLNIFISAQINLTGTASYKFTISGFQGEDSKACGNIYGLRELNLSYNDGSTENLWSGRIWNEDFSHEKLYTKNKKITGVQIYSINRWKTFVGCNGGPSHDKVTLPVSGVCTNQLYGNPVHVTTNVRVKTFPAYTINFNSSQQYILGSDENLKITLPDNLDAGDYVWKYSIAGGAPTAFPNSYNNVAVLNIPASEFVDPAQYGNIISVWVESPCMDSVEAYKSNTFFFTTLKASPHINSSIVTPVKCSDTSDGTVTLNFDRVLASNETLKISVINTETGAAVLNQDITTGLQTSTSYILQNLPAGKYKLDLLGTYGSNATYTDSSTHTISFEILKPAPVTFSLTSQTHVFCFQGSDGMIALTADGGQNQFQYRITKEGQPYLDWTNFSNGNNAQIQNFAAGVYKIKVRDSNLCVAKENGSEKEITVTITQPAAAIAIPAAEIEISQPTGYGLSNGYISIRVVGGTPNSDGSYLFEWRKDTANGPVINTGITTDAVNNPFTIKLDGLPAGKYYLTVKDKNYSGASSQLGNCGIISREFIIEQPLPLTANIEVEKQISCNIANNYQYKADLNGNGTPDEAEDGMLKAVVTGGVGTYTYQWLILNNGLFQNIAGATQASLGNLTTGTYKVLVKDFNNNAVDTQHSFVFPAELAITLSANTIACYNQSGGQVSVTATGGTGAYSYQWNTNDTTPTVTGLSAGNYFVLVNDSKNCKVSGSTQILGPDQLLLEDLSVVNPICFGAANGEIKIKVSGGKAPYDIAWSNGASGLNNIGISAGIYTVTVTDANGCSIFKNYTLSDPTQLKVDLGPDVTLCLGDTQTYNVDIHEAGATYQWKDQSGSIISSNPSVIVSKAGTYTVLITNSKGCTATDTVVIKNSMDVLNPQLMLTTHAYVESTVVLVNTSPTKPQKVEWVVPNTPDIQILNKTDDFLELKFFTTGSYEIGLKGIQGECVKTFYKKVVVEENTSGININPEKASNIREFTILPNPNNGVFKVLVGLEKEAPVTIKIIDMVSHEAYPATKMPSSTFFTVPFNTSLPGGAYLIILETGNEALVKRMLVQ